MPHRIENTKLYIYVLIPSKQHVLQRKAAWPEAGLAKELGTSVDVLRRKIGFWVKHGVLMEKLDRTGNSHSYTRTTHLAAGDLGNEAATIAMDEDEGESALVSQEEQLKQVSPTISDFRAY